MERTESGWEQPAEPEPAPRWRALLDRALLGRSGEHHHVSAPPVGQQRSRASVEQSYGERYERGNYRQDGYDQGGRGRSGDARGGDARGGRGRGGRDAGADRYDARYAPAEPAVGAPAYGEPGYGEPGYGEPGYGEPAAAGYGRPYGGAAATTERYESPYEQSSYQSGQIEWREPARHDDATAGSIAALRRDLGRPRVLAFANPKGGVHKTTATALTAATIGSVRGRGVLAWDDNELRGTLGLRAGSARHARTIRHLITDLADVEATSGLELADRVDDYLRHASDGTYDVLAGEENPRFAQRLDRQTVRRVLELLCRTHDVVCVDTGNNVESANWQTVLQAADQLVVTTVPREDAAFTADWMLDLLHEQGMGQLADNAVTLLSCATPGHQPLLDDLRAHFASRTRAVAVVPYDPALDSGSSIEPAMLQPETKQAWLHAAAKMVDSLSR